MSATTVIWVCTLVYIATMFQLIFRSDYAHPDTSLFRWCLFAIGGAGSWALMYVGVRSWIAALRISGDMDDVIGVIVSLCIAFCCLVLIERSAKRRNRR